MLDPVPVDPELPPVPTAVPPEPVEAVLLEDPPDAGATVVICS